MNFVEMTSTYKELKQDFDLQCLENARKQEQIIELRRHIRDLEEQHKELLEKIDRLVETNNLLQKLNKELNNGYTSKQSNSRKTSKQTKKI